MNILQNEEGNRCDLKTGILVYRPYGGLINIGDYIQSLAALELSGGEPEWMVDREALDSYLGEPLRLILNGWFMHHPAHWPPAPGIQPLFISFHLTPSAKEQLLDPKGVDYFKKHEPIGCRDHYTREVLEQHGIRAYFSGCLTLTLGKAFRLTSRSGQIYFVDPWIATLSDWHSIPVKAAIFLWKPRLILQLMKKKYRHYTWFHLRSTLSFYREYSSHFSDKLLLQAEYLEHLIPEQQLPTEQERFDLAAALLKKYATAGLVVTSRLHCALPCLALDTPVLYVENARQSEEERCRLHGIRELLHRMVNDRGKLRFETKERWSKVTPSTPIQNKPDYRALSEQLKRTVDRWSR